MFDVINIIFVFWYDLMATLNNLLIDRMNFDLKVITFEFYANEISLYNYFVLLATLLTVLFVIYITYRFFRFLYRMVVRVWY